LVDSAFSNISKTGSEAFDMDCGMEVPSLVITE